MQHFPRDESRPSPLDARGREFLSALNALDQGLAHYLDDIEQQPAFAAAPDPAWQPMSLPEHGEELETILARLFMSVAPYSFNTASPGYFAYVPGGGLPAAAIADLFTNITNRYAAVWAASPPAVELETEAIRWLVEGMGLPRDFSGVFTTGGSLSNLIALVAAREQRLGHELQRGVAYSTDEVHHCVDKALRIAGITHSRRVEVDSNFRMSPLALSRAIAEDRERGLLPFFVVASAGTVNSGVVDPLAEIADICQRENLWFHVDGAYGGLFALVEELRPTLRGMERADSIAVDPHKGLFLPYGTGALLTPHMAALRSAFGSDASYMPDFQSDEARVDFCEVTPELSRDWRGLRVWLPLRWYGAQAFRDMLREKRELACFAYEFLSALDDQLELLAPPDLSLFAFRQRLPGVSQAAENQHNREWLQRVNADGRVMITGTTMGGSYYLRICVLHLRSHRDRVEVLLELLRRELRH